MQGVWLGALLVLLSCRGPQVLPRAELEEPEPVEVRDPEPELESPGASEGTAGAPPVEQEPLLGEGGADSRPSDCPAQPITLDEVHSGRVRPNVAVSLAELSATSQKFLLSEAKSGSCLWGAFAADPERTGPGSGLFLVSFGAPHEAGMACQSGSDGLPDDLAPGDRLAVQGYLSTYAPSACARTTVAQTQLRIDAGCPARRVGRGSAPSAVPITSAVADALATSTDVELLRAYSGVLVELTSVSVREDPDDGDGVFPFGVVRLAETALELHSRIYYYDLAGGGPREPLKAPSFVFPTHFERARGIVFLDYCTWALGPRDRCHDLSPASGGCSP